MDCVSSSGVDDVSGTDTEVGRNDADTDPVTSTGVDDVSGTDTEAGSDDTGTESAA